MLHGIVDTTDNGGAGVVGVQGAGTGGGVFVLGKQPFQLRIFLRPTIFAGVKSIRQTAPAYILGKHLLFLGGGTTMLLFQFEQGADGFNVPGILLLCAALAQMVVCDAEVPSRLRRRFSIQGFIQGSSIREGLHLSVHHSRDGQFVQFLIGKFRLNLPQSVLELTFVDNFVIPRLPVCTGVDAHIGITDIAYCSFNRSGGKVYYNFVPDLIADLFFGNQINGCGLLFFVQFSDVRKMLIAENGQSVFRQLPVLQADGFERKINVFHPKIPAIQLDDAADWQIIRFPEIFCLVVGAIFVQASQIDVVARCPQLFRFCCPLLTRKTSYFDFAKHIFL